MQGLESLNQFQNFVSSLGGLGRFEDTYMIHAAEGETVVPMEVLNQNPLLKERLFESMRDMGIQPERYIVGNELNSKNPVTGQPEFFLKRIKKAIADISGYAAPVIGAMYGPAAGAAAGAAMGSFKRENPGDPSQWAKMGMLGGASGAAANYLGGARGMGILTGGGIQGAGGLGDFLFGRVPRAMGDMGTKGLFGTGGTFGLGTGTIGDLISKVGGKSFEDVLVEVTEKYPNMSAENQQKLAEKISGKSRMLLAGLLGLGGTLGLGKLIGEPEDITIDESKIRTAPIDTGQVFSPTQPTTVYTDYNIPITPYQAAEGGIIGNPHRERPDRIPLTDEMKDRMYDWLLDFIYKQRMREEMENEGRIIPVDPNAPIEVAGGGILDLQGGGMSLGPGTETSDSIPAMLSDGEFVMTAKAVRGAGGGDRREGARKMYEAMDRLEARA
tara:strand:- start:3542 stop:4867 length:1326 start_codon:yes stop_codon:yes gene_type:complete